MFIDVIVIASSPEANEAIWWGWLEEIATSAFGGLEMTKVGIP